MRAAHESAGRYDHRCLHAPGLGRPGNDPAERRRRPADRPKDLPSLGKKRTAAIRPLSPVFGEIFDREKGEILDEAFLTYFAAPRSYTREDVVELSCHGSPVVLEETVRLGIKAGARLAGPGEFTLRAYLNGRLDMLQAEAVNDLITAATLSQAKISTRQLRGGLSRMVTEFRRTIVAAASLLEAAIEFPDEETGTHLGQRQRRPPVGDRRRRRSRLDL